MADFRQVPYIPFGGSEQQLENDFSRVVGRQIYPGRYPFWTRHAAEIGMTYLDFDPTIVANRVTVDIQLRVLDKAPLLIAWLRPAKADGSYDPDSRIYKFPVTIRDDTGDATESYNQQFFTQAGFTRFARYGIKSYGTSTTYRTYITYFLFNDELVVNYLKETGLTFF